MSLQKISVTVKTLDSKNHVFDVSEELTVKQFKEVISPVVSIPVETQRLIFRGRVLQDDKKILEYNVANNTIHLVQRPNAPPPGSNQNDEPQNLRNVGGDDHFDGGGHGIIITAGTNPTDHNAIFMGTIGNMPSVDIPVGEQTVHPMNPSGVPRRASSASVRLQIGNEMINRASTLLSRLEEDDEISAAQAQASSSSSAPTTTTENDEAEEESHDSQSSDSNTMEIDPEDPGSFNRMISQVANAAVLASVRTINPNSNEGINVLGQLGAGSNNDVESNIGTAPTNNNNNNSQGSNRRPEAPRVRELAIALQDLIAFQERLLPFLQFVQNMLRENCSYNSETGELQSMQFVYDQVSSILHLLGHGFHAFSDLVCDFSSAPQTRRLISAPGILVEQSTVVRATIPVPVPVAAFASNLPTNPNATQQQQQQQQSQFIWSQLAGNNNTNNPQQQQQQPSSASPSTNPPSTQQRPPNTSFFSTNPSSGNVPTGISINIQSNGMPDLASLLAGATGGGGAGVLPFLSFGNLQQQPSRAQQQQPQNNSSTPRSGTNSNPTTTTSSNNNNANNNNTSGNNNLQQTLRNEFMRPPFDILLSCHSHHASRNRPRQRPSNLHTHVKVESSSSTTTTTSAPSPNASFDFFQSLIDLIRSSNCLELFQPYLKDIIQNYLMRGRDVKNQLHIKTCARTIAKKHTNFFKSFVDNISEKDSTIDMQKTLSELVSSFYFKLFSLVLNSGPREFRNSVILLWEDSMTKLFTIFRVCFPNNNNRVPELFAKAIVDEYFVGASLIFKTYAKTSLQNYFVAFCSQITNGSIETNGLIFKINDEDSSTSSSNQQASISTPSTSSNNSGSSRQPSISNNVASTSSSVQSVSSTPAKKNTPDAMEIETDLDIDNLIAPSPPSTNESARTESNRIERIPPAWRDVVLEDINRQMSLVNQQPPSRSVGFSTLFPSKN